MEDAEVVLRRAPLFEGLDEDSARALRRQMPDVKLSRGEHLFMEGQEGDPEAGQRDRFRFSAHSSAKLALARPCCKMKPPVGPTML